MCCFEQLTGLIPAAAAAALELNSQIEGSVRICFACMFRYAHETLICAACFASRWRRCTALCLGLPPPVACTQLQCHILQFSSASCICGLKRSQRDSRQAAWVGRTSRTTRKSWLTRASFLCTCTRQACIQCDHFIGYIEWRLCRWIWPSWQGAPVRLDDAVVHRALRHLRNNVFCAVLVCCKSAGRFRSFV